MKKNSVFVLSVILVLVSNILVGQVDNAWKTTSNGLKYKYFIKNEEAQKPKIGDMVTVVGYYQATDTIFFDSRKSPTPYIFPVAEPTYHGDIFEGIKMLAIGDSAAFLLKGDSLFFKTFMVKQLPNYIRPGSDVTFYVKLLKIQPKDEFQKEMQAKFEAESKLSAELTAKEDSLLKDYIAKNEFAAESSSSGLYYVEVEKGAGVKAEPGKTVVVHYTGKLLDGTIFDSSHNRSEPFSFPLGKNKVIRGWEEGIAKMKKGGKAVLLIPSRLAYGQGKVGKIPPNSVLIFEVELLDVL